MTKSKDDECLVLNRPKRLGTKGTDILFLLQSINILTNPLICSFPYTFLTRVPDPVTSESVTNKEKNKGVRTVRYENPLKVEDQ